MVNLFGRRQLNIQGYTLWAISQLSKYASSQTEAYLLDAVAKKASLDFRSGKDFSSDKIKVGNYEDRPNCSDAITMIAAPLENIEISVRNSKKSC